MGVSGMKQCSSILNTYAADVSGVCSALYELGGMVIMDDASGCNSTYNTHDEPRWYTMPSMVYVSALTELQAVLGHDDHLADEIVAAASELHPRFIAIAGTPIPMMMGTDFAGLAHVIEKRCGIPVMGFDTNGMHSYANGAGRALAAFAKRFCTTQKPKAALTDRKTKVNIIGATPLDFSITGNLEALKSLITAHGYDIVSVWAMGSSFEQLMNASCADVNIVVSAAGLETAVYFEKQFGIPYITGIPTGCLVTGAFFASIDAAVRTNKTQEPVWYEAQMKVETKDAQSAYVIGEAIWASCIARALRDDFVVQNVRVLCPTDFDEKRAGITSSQLLGAAGQMMVDEDDFFDALKNSPLVIADPLYKYAVSERTKFIPLPHEGYSGRIFRKAIPIIMGSAFDDWIRNCL